MILVMTVLGLLFVTGVALMATMSFESELIEVAREHAKTQPVIDDVAATIDEFLAAGVGEIIDAAGLVVIEQPDTAMESLSSMPFAQTPGRFNSFSPIEPYVDDPRLGRPNNLVWGWFTDVEALAGQKTDYFANTVQPDLRMDTAWKSGVDPDPTNYPPDLTPVDADGDGIVDANQVNIEKLGFTRRQIDPLAKVLNARSNPAGSVYLGLRIVPHGGMVNLADAHPLLIRELFSMGPNDRLPQDRGNFKPYSPLVEEASLRRRGMLPPRELPPTQILGSLLNSDPDTGGADYEALYWPKETVAEHRYFPFAPDEFDPQVHPDDPIWRARMDPENANQNNILGDEYDRRHLVTSISHDDLIRRATVIDVGGQRMDVVDWARDNITLDAFPYLDYPSGPNAFPNTYTGASEDFDRFNWNDCEGDSDCEFNASKGRLRLSMGWLDEMWDWGELTDPVERARNREIATKTIQDAFTLMLLNARGSEWENDNVDPTSNDIPPQDLNGDGDFDDPGEAGKRIWDFDYDAISRAAAELTANLIDFADDDNDLPTAVEIRSADYTGGTASIPFGQGTGEFVYGLENQPYITEVAARAKALDGEPAKADVATSTYGIELFNPDADRSVSLKDYYLEVTSTTDGGTARVSLSSTLPIQPGKFVGFVWGAGGANGISGDGKNSGNLDFTEGTIIKLILQHPDGTDVLVDVFDLDLSHSPVGKLDDKLRSSQRYANDGINRWYATVPETSGEKTKANIGFPTDQSAPSWQPVQAIIANQGSFSTAFPTTGSLLLLMRHANSENGAFTSRLGENGSHPIDDGRMPIYDVENEMFHHLDPSVHPTKLAGAMATDTIGQSGTIDHLPWGQLVFDYFTALPLENPGPYGDYDVIDPLTSIRKEQPRVDLDGMRAHGRIDINAAPWFVMKGLPFIRMDLVPDGFENIFARELRLQNEPRNVAQPIGSVRAQAIAAYRDQRLIRSSDFRLQFAPLSGDYDTDPNFGRGWNVTAPKIRRGMGFLSIGELANVRHPNADTLAPQIMRLDGGVVGTNDTNHQGTYLEAVAALACLSDWVSVRSQVFTAYGTLRGDMDPTIEHEDMAVQEEMQRKDVDTRAIRFQETIDRLPTFLGAEEPARIGSRVLATYNDVRND